MPSPIVLVCDVVEDRKGAELNGLYDKPTPENPYHCICISSRLRTGRNALGWLLHELCHAARPDLRENAVELASLRSRLGAFPEPAAPRAVRASNALLAKLGPYPSQS